MKHDLEWTMLRAVLAVAEEGSMTAAAKVLGQSQPTISRHISAAEDAVGQYLFERHERGLVPSDFCERLLPEAREIRDSLRRLSLMAAGDQPKMEGRVRLTASVFVSVHLLPPILARIRADHPRITLDLVASDTSENLLFHEADLALRMYRPTQLDMVTRHLGDLPLGLYAAESYIARRGAPARPEDLTDHDMVGYDRDERLVRGMRDLGFDVTADWFTTRTDDQVAYWNLVAAGCGIGVGQTIVGDRTPGVRRLLPELALPVLPVWLTAHPALRHQPRVAAVWEALAGAIGPVLS